MQEMCDKAYPKFHAALKEWAAMVSATPSTSWPRVSDYRPRAPTTYRVVSNDGCLIGHFDDKVMAESNGKAWAPNGDYFITPLYQ
jgi:hypothetical protein